METPAVPHQKYPITEFSNLVSKPGVNAQTLVDWVERNQGIRSTMRKHACILLELDESDVAREALEILKAE